MSLGKDGGVGCSTRRWGTINWLLLWPKLAFQGVDAIKWKYTVMPFGPTNGPATFINFIYDIISI